MLKKIILSLLIIFSFTQSFFESVQGNNIMLHLKEFEKIAKNHSNW
jgi:hypothetical protein